MADPSFRRDRLLSLLPRIFSAQPEGSTIGTLIAVMAERLTALDDDLTRVMRDRWVGLASGVRADGDSALELLGGLLDRDRLDRTDPGAPTAEALEKTEAYRQRLTVTARTLTRGLGTPRAILSLALADLGAEACPLMRAVLPPTMQSDADWRVDATVAWGVRPALRRLCPVCAKGTSLAGEACPNYDQRVLDGWITENPLLTKHHTEHDLALWRPFEIRNQSLAADRPVVQLTALGDLSYPALQNRAAAEITLYADILRDGETLTIWPKPLWGETRPFDGYDRVEHHPWLLGQPNGQARVTRPGGSDRDVSAAIFFISGMRFGDVDSTYAGPPQPGFAPQHAEETGARFSVLDNIVRTPLLRSGNQSWMLLQFANPGRRFDDGDSRFADRADAEGTRFADWDDAPGGEAARESALFSALRRAELAAAQAQDRAAAKPVVKLALQWFTRAPATFRLTIPRTGWVEAAEVTGAIDLLRSDLELARPAGVRALIDFPQPTWRDGPAADEDWESVLHPWATVRWQEDTDIVGLSPRIAASLPVREEHAIDEGILLMRGLYNVTRFDMSVLG